jgi:hypothetical protein
MLAALVNRLDALLGAGDSKSGQTAAKGPVQKILHWSLPRCTVYDEYTTCRSDGTKSKADEPRNSVDDVYVYAGSRQCYIKYAYMPYVLSAPLPTSVDSNAVWEITTNSINPLSLKKLKIGDHEFTMTSVPILPWIDKNSLWQDPIEGTSFEEIECNF